MTELQEGETSDARAVAEPAIDSRRAFARRLQNLAGARGWGVTELSRNAGLPRDVINAYWRGVAVPRPGRVAAIARALGTTPAQLLGRPDTSQVAEETGPTVPHIVMTTLVGTENRAHLTLDLELPFDTVVEIMELIRRAGITVE